jgi:uncharacterized protein YodC (DUF2158 family)
MPEELKEGDTVYLKSGGPRMTIDKIAVFSMGGTTKEARCVWFDGKKRMVELFELHSLTKEDPGDGGQIKLSR